VRAIEYELQSRHPRAVEAIDRYRAIAERTRLDPRNVVDESLLPETPSVIALVEKAREAIAAGANVDAVRERLRSLNVDPRWLDVR
jgi:hypothetical protein